MGVESTTLTPYLDEIVSSLLAMLGPASKNYVQEQAITTLAMVADAAAANFQKVCATRFPSLGTEDVRNTVL